MQNEIDKFQNQYFFLVLVTVCALHLMVPPQLGMRIHDYITICGGDGWYCILCIHGKVYIYYQFNVDHCNIFRQSYATCI